MFQHQQSEGPIRERRKVLLIAGDSSARRLISTFLMTMGCACVVVSTQEEFVSFERENFDAVIIDLANSGLMAEPAIVRLHELHPSLSERTLAFSSDVTDPGLIELVERYSLRQISQEGLLQQVWATLQGLFEAPRLGKLLPRAMQVAQLIFDSFRLPLPIGVRGSPEPGRQLAYQHHNKIVDLLIEPREETGRVSLAGQVMGVGMRKGENSGLAVLLIDRMQTRARTTTNQFGEFQLEFDVVENLGLQIRLGEGSWASIPLGKMDWIKKRLSGLQAERSTTEKGS
jgi:CheY-like chemotaxis protein